MRARLQIAQPYLHCGRVWLRIGELEADRDSPLYEILLHLADGERPEVRNGCHQHRIGVAFEQAGRWFDMKRVAVVGFPVRREILQVSREESLEKLQVPPGKRVVFAFGGSGGSRAVNEGLVAALPRLRQRGDLFIRLARQ